MTLDLFSVDILDEDIERFRALDGGVLIEGSLLGGKIAIVSNERALKQFKMHGTTCYFPEEIRYLLSLSIDEARKINEMKRVMGGHVKELK